MTLINDTLSDNTTSGGAGGSGGSPGASGLQPIAGSNGGANGGGLYAGGGSVGLINSTIADNDVASGGTGGGLEVDAGTATLDNTIVALNTNGTGSGATADDIAGAVSSTSAYNLIGTGGSGGLTNGSNGNQVGVASPGLGPLAFNGGPTQTIALLAGSPAINAGSNALAVDPTTGQPLLYDQRGPGFPRIEDNTVNIGAFESDGIFFMVTTQPPASVTAGAGFGLTVTAEDASGNVDTSFNGTVTVSLLNNPGNATLGGTLTATAQDGVATFSDLMLDRAESGYTLVISGSGPSSSSTDAITVTPAAVSQLVVTVQPPANVLAGSGFGLVAVAEDQFGNVATSFDGSVAVALLSNPGGATLGGTLSVTAQNGVATFTGLTLDEAGTGYTLQVSSNGLAAATTSAFNVTVEQLVVTVQPPGSISVGSGFGLTVTAEDSSGNVLTSFNGTVTVALSNNPGAATLGGTLTATAQDGVATFSGLTLNEPGMGYTLQVSSSGLTTATTSAFNVTAQLAVTVQPPASISVGAGFGLTVTAEDSSGNVLTSFNGTITVALSNNPGTATLGGTLTATAQDGVATFSDLTLDEPGIGYTLQVSGINLAAATTNPFNVQTAVGSSVVVEWGTSGTDTLQTASDGLRLLPAGRNTDMPWLGIDQFTITLAQATSLAAGDVTVSSAIGADYGPVTVSGSGTSYTITLAQPIDQADLVSITIGNATIASFTRVLDVLPGDFNDDGVVNAQDLVGVRNEWLHVDGATYTIFGDINGDGVVNVTDYNDVRAEIGTTLPPVAPSNLLINGDFSLGNTGFTSQYVYSTDLEPEGNYVVGNNPQNYNSGGASFGDHTTGTGLMLIANGAPTPNTVVWQETVSVSTATDYVFTGWAASWGELGNGIDPSPAQLEFFVNGVQIGSEFTLIAQDGQWSQFSASWNSGTSASATITIVDMNTTPVGNDFALDDLAFSQSEAATAAVVVATQPLATVTTGSGLRVAGTGSGTSGTIAAAQPTVLGNSYGDGLVNGADANPVPTAIGTSLPQSGGDAVAADAGQAGLAPVVRIKPSRASSHDDPTTQAPAPRAEIRLAARGRAGSLGISSRTAVLDRLWPEGR